MAIREKQSGDVVTGDPAPCSKCGCNDIRDSPSGKYCRYCGKRWIQRAAPPKENEPETTQSAMIYHIIRCPVCKSEKTRVTRTKRPIRYHKCKDCTHNFKSFEQ